MYDCAAHVSQHRAACGCDATGAGLIPTAARVVIRGKFSARQFGTIFQRWDCTLFQYIGELCRYLVMPSRIRRVPNTGSGCAAAMD